MSDASLAQPTRLEKLRMNHEQIKRGSVYKHVYEKLETREGSIRVRGEFDGWKIDFWVNKKTKVIESAFPKLN